MHGIRLFTIPIYSRDPEKHVCAERGRKAKFLSEIIRPAAPEDGAEWEHRYDQWYFMPWPYSQMIGAVEIRLNHFGDMKAFYWFVDAKRITDRMRNKK